MSEWKAKRFWKDASVTTSDTGFQICLDGRPIKAADKSDIVLPTPALADLVVAEWDAQVDEVDFETMPTMRLVNAALGKFTLQKSDSADQIAAYGDSDLLCYRAPSPEGLIERQTQHWDPLLDWAASALDVRLEPRSGVIHASQSGQANARLRAIVHGFTSFELAAMHDLVGLSGSLIIGLAVSRNHAPDDVLWGASRVDEDWQIEQWGVDEDAAIQAALKKQAFLHAGVVYRSLNRTS